MKNSLNTLQFELWSECNNNCKFCYLGSTKHHTDNEIKLFNIQNAYKIVSNEDIYITYNCIGFIGGEFFQGQLNTPELKDAFYSLIKKTAEIYNKKLIKQVWITATLTIGDQHDLYNCLKYFNDYDNVWISTSWDLEYRFHSEKQKNTWYHHIKSLKVNYPSIKINVTTILTQALIEHYLNSSFRFYDMAQEYSFTWFFKHPGTFLPWKTKGTFEELRKLKIACNEIIPKFFANRQDYIKFLIKFKEQEPKDYFARLYNINLRADTLIKGDNSGHLNTSIRQKDNKLDLPEFNALPCGHTFVYSAYIDSDNCILCDTKAIGEFE